MAGLTTLLISSFSKTTIVNQISRGNKLRLGRSCFGPNRGEMLLSSCNLVAIYYVSLASQSAMSAPAPQNISLYEYTFVAGWI